MSHPEKTLRHACLALLAAAGLGLSAPALAQTPLADDAPIVIETLTPAQLQDVVGPVALYPDDLLAVVLPASAYPLQIVQATRFLDDLEQDKNLKPDPAWDESIVALLNYPDVLRLMNDDLDWTYDLGAAVVNQQPDVIAAIETFRDRAYDAGNLKSDERQRVEREDDRIVITPIEREVIYVPYYEPERVVVVQRSPVYHYYPRPYPLYYYPYPAYYSFHNPYFFGVTSVFQIGWPIATREYPPVELLEPPVLRPPLRQSLLLSSSLSTGALSLPAARQQSRRLRKRARPWLPRRPVAAGLPAQRAQPEPEPSACHAHQSKRLHLVTQTTRPA